MPVFDQNDVDILALGLGTIWADSTLAKVHDLVINYLWHQYCACDAPPQPALPTPVPNPSGTSTGGGLGNAPQPCFSGSTAYDVPTTGAPPATTLQNITTQLLPTDGRLAQDTVSQPNRTIYGIPPGVQSIQFQSFQPPTALCPTSAGSQIMPGVTFYNSSAALISGGGVLSGPQYPNNNTSGSLAIPATASYWYANTGYSFPNCGAVTGQAQVKTQVLCAPAGTLASCCPPDPSITLALNSVLQLLNQIQAELQHPALTDGTVHSGLSGSGSLVFTGVARAIRVNVASIPPGLSSGIGVPPFVASLGFITPLAEGVGMRSQRLSFQTQTFALDAIATGVGWNVSPGLTFSITELV
jgi:hypothetical protein